MEGQCLICKESRWDSPQIKHCPSIKNIYFSTFFFFLLYIILHSLSKFTIKRWHNCIEWLSISASPQQSNSARPCLNHARIYADEVPSHVTAVNGQGEPGFRPGLSSFVRPLPIRHTIWKTSGLAFNDMLPAPWSHSIQYAPHLIKLLLLCKYAPHLINQLLTM